MKIDIEDFGPVIGAILDEQYPEATKTERMLIGNQFLGFMLPGFNKLMEMVNEKLDAAVIEGIHSFLTEEWEKAADDPVRNVIEYLTHRLFGTVPDDDGLTFKIYQYIEEGLPCPIGELHRPEAPCAQCGETRCNGAEDCKGYRRPDHIPQTQQNPAGAAENAPDGWHPFGYHAGLGKYPPLQFSAEKDPMDGLPLHEREILTGEKTQAECKTCVRVTDHEVHDIGFGLHNQIVRAYCDVCGTLNEYQPSKL